LRLFKHGVWAKSCIQGRHFLSSVNYLSPYTQPSHRHPAMLLAACSGVTSISIQGHIARIFKGLCNHQQILRFPIQPNQYLKVSNALHSKNRKHLSLVARLEKHAYLGSAHLQLSHIAQLPILFINIRQNA